MMRDWIKKLGLWILFVFVLSAGGTLTYRLTTVLFDKSPADPLINCLENSKTKGGLITSEKQNDSTFLRLCERYHRDKLIERYSMKKYYHKNEDGEYIKNEDGSLKFDLIPRKKKIFSVSDMLLYIETGQVPRDIR